MSEDVLKDKFHKWLAKHYGTEFVINSTKYKFLFEVFKDAFRTGVNACQNGEYY